MCFFLLFRFIRDFVVNILKYVFLLCKTVSLFKNFKAKYIFKYIYLSSSMYGFSFLYSAVMLQYLILINCISVYLAIIIVLCIVIIIPVARITFLEVPKMFNLKGKTILLHHTQEDFYLNTLLPKRFKNLSVHVIDVESVCDI